MTAIPMGAGDRLRMLKADLAGDKLPAGVDALMKKVKKPAPFKKGRKKKFNGY
jgi:hypothetical protein